MGYPLTLALRYLGSKKRSFISVGTGFAMLGVTLGVAALATVMSVTGGFQDQFREKVLGVNAHVLVLKYSLDFREYREVMRVAEGIPGVTGVAPFVINPMMVTHGDRTATGVLLKGVDPEAMPKVLDLPKHIVSGSIDGMRRPGAKAPENRSPVFMPPPSFQNQNAPASDAGTTGFLDVVRKQIAEDQRRDAELDGGDRRDDAPPTPSMPSAQTSAGVGALPTPTPALPSVQPREEAVTPSGGYASKLPDEDVLPDAIDPDPCKSATAVAALPGAVVGKSLARQLNLKLGDCLQVTSPTIGVSFGATGMRPAIAKRFRVIAMFEAGFDQYDSKLVYTDLYESQAFSDQGDSVTGVEMKVRNIDDAHAISKELEKRLGNGIYHTMDWRELNHGLFTALFIQQVGMSVVLALIIVVAAFTVIATLIMVVLDKKKEIALLKAIGAKDDAILRVFLYQGGIIGLIGTLSGLLLGFFCCKVLLAYGFPLDPKVYFISRLPVNIRPTEFLITGVVSVVICLLATIFPALYAAWLRPADGLRSE